MHLAQLNIAEAKYAIGSQDMAGFTGRINAINALADRAPGFIWRLKDDGPEDGALSLRMEGLGGDMLINMSVWESLKALFGFVYKTAHAKVMREERPQFKRIPREHMVLWWIPEGHIPTLSEAKAKLDLIRGEGASPAAFSFASSFDEDGQAVPNLFPNIQKKDSD